MPPRRSARSASAAPQQALTIDSLPDETLAAVLGGLPLEYRHNTAALVCRRWRDAVNSSALLRRLRIRLHGSGDGFLPCLGSLAEWLAARAAPHVQQLDLDLWMSGAEGQAEAQAEAGQLVAGMLAACGGSGSQLRELSLYTSGFPIFTNSWLRPFGSSLQKLTIIAGYRTPVVIASLPPLPALRELELYCENIQLRPTARLPPTLTTLIFSGIDENATVLPPQVGALTNLHTLSIDKCKFSPDSYAPLAQLSSSLQRLYLDGTTLPTCLGRLTSLEALHIEHLKEEDEEDAAGTLRAALPQLTALSYLSLTRIPGMDSPPAELAGLSSLRCFAWGGDGTGRLPGGAWLTGLQQLAAPASLLARSLPWLAAAGQLTQLGVSRDVSTAGTADAAVAVVGWALEHPSLQHLQLDTGGGYGALPDEVGAAVAEARARRPGLHIEVKRGVFPGFPF